MLKIKTHALPSHNCIEVALLWAATASAVLIFMLVGRGLLTAAGFSLPLISTFMVFGVIACAFFIFIPPIMVTPYGKDEPPSKVIDIISIIFVLAVVTLPFLLILRRIVPVSKVQITALLAIASMGGLASAFFYALFPRFHFSFFTAATLGFPFLFLTIYEIWGSELYYLATLSPFVTIYYLSPEYILDNVGIPWTNTVLIFGLITFTCIAYIFLVSRPDISEKSPDSV